MQSLNLEPEGYSVDDSTNADYSLPIEYPGIGRLGYFVGMVGLGVLDALLRPTSRFEEPSPFLGLLVFFGAIALVVNRVRNIGMSGWWALLALIPIVNLWIGFKCLIAQEGYQDASGLDSTGKILCGVVLAFCGLMVFIVVFALIAS